MDKQPIIVAVDFDGILCENRFPEIGSPNRDMMGFVKEMVEAGVEVVLWTSRVDKELSSAVDWCLANGLLFCAINDNAPSNVEQYKNKYPNGTRKVYADIYIDDNTPRFKYIENTYGRHTALNEAITTTRRVLEMEGVIL